jgi:hypothetical protein
MAAGWNKGIKHSKQTRENISKGMFDYWKEHKDERIDELREMGHRLGERYMVWVQNGGWQTKSREKQRKQRQGAK